MAPKEPKRFLLLFSINTRLRWSQSVGFAEENPTPAGLRVYRIIQIKRSGLHRSHLSRLKGIKNASNYLDAFALDGPWTIARKEHTFAIDYRPWTMDKKSLMMIGLALYYCKCTV